MKINFFTIVLNGMPFIKKHIDIFNKLSIPWQWHIIEGVALPVRDSSWMLKFGGKIEEKFHKNGLSTDGTAEYIDELKRKYPEKILVYRKENGEFWEGKVEMCNAPLKNINEESLLWQIDVDEIWQSWQIEKLFRMFLLRPDKYSAFFFCRYFVGKNLVITSRDTYGNKTFQEWLRVWRFTPGMFWYMHSPPTLVFYHNDNLINVGKINPFLHKETESQGLIFDHYAYSERAQLEFKESYYGYKNAVKCWETLNAEKKFPVFLKDYFHWVDDNAIVDKVQKFQSSKNLLIIRTDAIGDHVLFMGTLQYFRKIFKEYSIFFLTQEHIQEILKECPYIDEVIPFKRDLALTDQYYLNSIINFLQSKNFDIAIYPVFSREALGDILTFGSRARFKIGVNGNKERISQIIKEKFDKEYDFLINIDENLNEINKNRYIINEILNFFGEKPIVSKITSQIWINEKDTIKIDNFFKANNLEEKSFIVISPTALVNIRNWQIEKWKEIIDYLKEYPIVITGSTSEIEYIKKIIRICNHKKIYNIAGNINLRELAYLISKAKFVITLESAPAHIATAVKTPCIIILGGGHFGRFIPYSTLQYPVYKEMDCFNCNWKCIYPTIKCIESIQPSDVKEVIKNLLGESDA